MDLFFKLLSFISDNIIVVMNILFLFIIVFVSVLFNFKNVVGLYFFNFVLVMEFVEIVVGYEMLE